MCYVAIAEIAIAAIGTAYEIHAEKQAAKYSEQVDLNQAKLDKVKAENANAMGSYAADQARIRGNLLRGQQIAAFAANNVDVTTGTAADILGDTAMFTAADQRQARINAAQQAYGFQVDSLNAQGAAKYAMWQGKTQETASMIQGASSALGAAQNGFGKTSSPSFTGSGNTVLTGGTYNGPNSTNLGLWGGT